MKSIADILRDGGNGSIISGVRFLTVLVYCMRRSRQKASSAGILVKLLLKKKWYSALNLIDSGIHYISYHLKYQSIILSEQQLTILPGKHRNTNASQHIEGHGIGKLKLITVVWCCNILGRTYGKVNVILFLCMNVCEVDGKYTVRVDFFHWCVDTVWHYFTQRLGWCVSIRIYYGRVEWW